MAQSSEPANSGRDRKTAARAFVKMFAFVYLFVFPMCIAADPYLGGIFGIALGSILVAQLFVYVFLLGYRTSVVFYGRTVALPLALHMVLQVSDLGQDDRSLILSMFLSFFAFNYAFAVLYVFLSHVDCSCFETVLSAIDGMYFASVVGTTVGFGDIAPKGQFCRLLVTLQIYLGLAYVVILFSACSAYLRDKRGGALSSDRDTSSFPSTKP